jgi:hypothetical protein
VAVHWISQVLTLSQAFRETHGQLRETSSGTVFDQLGRP